MSFYAFLPKLLNMSLTASVAIVFVLLLRLLLRRAPKVISYALWVIVLFRLLCPVSIPSSLSLFGLLDAPVAPDGTIAYVPADLVHTENPSVVLPVPGLGEAITGTLPQGEEQLVADPLEAPMAIATFVWMAGGLAMAGYALASYARLRRKLVTASPLRDNIFLSDEITSPFVLGLFRPKIYVPSALEEREWPYIILHEQHHIRRLDHIVKAAAFAALCIHWFNPLVWLAFFVAGRDMELSCDEAVVRKLGEGVRADYSASLLSLATGRHIIAGMPLAFGEGDTKRRIRNLANWKKPAVWVVLAAILACIGLAAVLLTNPPQDQAEDSEREQICPVEAFDTEHLFLLESLEHRFAADGEASVIALYTSAQVATDGLMGWDSGDQWTLLVQQENESFVLYDEYVQYGEVQFWVSDLNPDEVDSPGPTDLEPHIYVMVTTDIGFTMYDCVWDAEHACFWKSVSLYPDNQWNTEHSNKYTFPAPS